MMRIIPFLILATSCTGDETLRTYAQADAVYVLQSLDDAPFPARATLEFTQAGKIGGQAPCNSYFATQTVPYPWFEVGPIGATRRACAELDQEARYFDALSAMQFSESLGDTLILSNDAGREMVFQVE